MMLESPSVNAGLAAWQKWRADLDAMPARKQVASLRAEKDRADKIIRMLTLYPNGLDARDPNFRRVVAEFAA